MNRAWEELWGTNLEAIAGYNVLVAAISLVSMRFLPETRGRELDESAATSASTVRQPVDA